MTDPVRQAFNDDYYLSQYPEVASSGALPFDHFMGVGWKEGRDPNPNFSVIYYLKCNPDVAMSGVNPFWHYIHYGKAEKRSSSPMAISSEKFSPKVSVIVPNYNHSAFLTERINSILAQTYDNIEIIVLDDNSTDGSQDLIKKLAAKHPQHIKTRFNAINSGNVFKQWRQGLELASGELVWICESDDTVDPRFLENLVPHFADLSVNMAFGNIQFIDKDGNHQPGMDGYRENAEPSIWRWQVKRPAAEWFSKGFGINNLIANVGGCVWRSQRFSDDLWAEAQTYSILGDWFLYSRIAAGGQIVFDPAAKAYFRQHGGNTSVRAFREKPYYIEHFRFMTQLRQRWHIPEATVRAFYSGIENQFKMFFPNGKSELDKLVDLDALLATKRTIPHVLIGFLGLVSGGGEVIAITLANALRNKGVNVSLVACSLSEVNTGMLKSVAPGIPIYDGLMAVVEGSSVFVRRLGASIVHTHMVRLEILFFEEGGEWAGEIPYLISCHGSYETSKLPPARLKTFADKIDKIVYTADRNLTAFEGFGCPNSKFLKMANGMMRDGRPLPATVNDLGIRPLSIVFTLVARGMPEKGWEPAINAFLELEKRTDKRVHLILVGSGPETNRLREIHGSVPNISFLGYRTEINGVYRMTDCAIVPTRFPGESFPLCIIQAMQEGVPVIATDIGEISGMVKSTFSSAGIIIPNERDDAKFTASLTDAMERMLDYKARKAYGNAARKRSRDFDINRVADQYLKLYDELING